jgi:L-threonylcarbamoyladenylate synthase
MEVRILPVREDVVDMAAVSAAARVFRRGKLVVFPTETVYGLGADPSNEAAVRALYSAKSRDADKPIAVLATDIGALSRWAQLTPTVRSLAEEFWPGPLTLILPPTAVAPTWLRQQGIGVRIPDHELARALCGTCGGLLAATSANRASVPPPESASELARELGPDVELILDAGGISRSAASTVIDLCVSPPKILREGPITADRILLALRRMSDE